jgi:hypothetical protein
MKFQEFDQQEYPRYSTTTINRWCFRPKKKILDRFLPDDQTRAFFVLGFFWRALADQCEYWHLREISPFAFRQCPRRCRDVRRPATYLLGAAQAQLSEGSLALAVEAMPEAMNEFIKSISDQCRWLSAGELAKYIGSLSRDNHIGGLRNGSDLARVAHQALDAQFNQILKAAEQKQKVAEQEQAAHLAAAREADKNWTVALERWRRPCPEWLVNLALPPEPPVFERFPRMSGNEYGEDATAEWQPLKALHDNLKELFRGSCVYPGAGSDWSPLRQLVDVCHSYIFFDYLDCNHELEARNLQSIWPAYPHARCLMRHTFNSKAFLDKECSRTLQRRVQNALDDYRRSEGIESDAEWMFYGGNPLGGSHLPAQWTLYELEPGHRVSLLYLRAEAIRGLGLLRLKTGVSPRALVLQDHGLGGNCWRGFGRPLHEIVLKKLRMAAPRILIADNDFNGFSRRLLPYQTLSEGVCYEAMHRNWRRIMILPSNPRSHRDGNCLILANGTKVWDLNGVCHREDGPAVVYTDGSVEWWLKGRKYDSVECWAREVFETKSLGHEIDTATFREFVNDLKRRYP